MVKVFTDVQMNTDIITYERGKIMVEKIWNYFIEHDMFTENELQLITSINGYTEETLNDCLYARFGYRDLEQMGIIL